MSEDAGLPAAALPVPGLGQLHPGAQAALRLLLGDELEAAKLMSEGALASPYLIPNTQAYLFDLRITGTYVAHRPALNEWAYRKAEDYLNDRFLQRCAGLPVIWEHPPQDSADKKNGMLDSEEFSKRIIGTVFYSYVRGDEVWAICKIYSVGAVEKMLAGQLSTSPMVVLGESVKLKSEDGDDLLIEGGPKFPDHLAICDQGVWDKGGAPSGVNISNGDLTMADEAKKEEVKADAARADAETLDKVLKGIDSLRSDVAACNSRLDSMEEEEKKVDAEENPFKEKEEEKKADKKRKDAEDDPIEEKLEAKPLVADKKRKDADEEEKAEEEKVEEKKADAARADALAAMEKSNADLRNQLDSLAKLVRQPIPDADRAALSDVQSRADAVMTQFGERAPAPLVGESPDVYARRMAGMLKKHSDRWAKVNLGDLHTADAFHVAEGQIYADAAARARAPNDLKPGVFREVRTMSPTGHIITEFHGGEGSHFVRGFTRPARHVRGIRTAS